MDKTEKIFFTVLAIGEFFVLSFCGYVIGKGLIEMNKEKPKAYIAIFNNERVVDNCYVSEDARRNMPDNVILIEKK